jgi:hypothetical protein
MEHLKTALAGLTVAGMLTFGATALTPSLHDANKELDRQGSHMQEKEKRRLRDEGSKLLDATLEDGLRPRLVIRP